MGKRSRDKGAGGERELAALFREFGYAAFRSAPIQAGHPEEACDLANTGPFAVESKRWAKARGLPEAIRSHLGKEFPGLVPLLAYREDHGEWVATLPLRELLKLVTNRVPSGELELLPGADAILVQKTGEA